MKKMIPYVGKPSLIFKKKMSEIVKEMYDVKLKCVFTSFKVKDYFSLKCRSSPFLASDVVYEFTCQCDTDKFYLGETDRHIGIWGGEHLDLEKKQVSAVGTHIQNCEGCFEKLEKGLLRPKKNLLFSVTPREFFFLAFWSPRIFFSDFQQKKIKV